MIFDRVVLASVGLFVVCLSVVVGLVVVVVNGVGDVLDVLNVWLLCRKFLFIVGWFCLDDTWDDVNLL